MNIAPIILLAVSAAVFYFNVGTQYDDLIRLQAESRELSDAQAGIAEIETLKADLGAKMEKFKEEDRIRLAEMIPDTFDITKTGNDLNALAVRHAIVMRSIRSISDAPRSFVIDPATGEPTEKRDVPKKTAVDVSLRGTYPALVAFLDDLATSLRIVDVTDVNFVAVDKAPGVFEYSMRAVVYSLR